MKTKLVAKLIFLIIFFSCSVPKTDKGDKPIRSIEKYRELRTEKLNQPRPVIHNNDGCDAYVYPVEREFSILNFLDRRLTGLKGSDVSTISYCTQCSGFGHFTYRTKIGEPQVNDPGRPGSRNVYSDFVEIGTDPLKVTTDFARENGFELFWSNRVNDCHDVAHTKDKPHPLWTKFKEEHPEFLFGEMGEKFPHGRWSAVDFSHKEVRDLCVQFYTEVCENYDVDGVELDFFRHLFLFRNVAGGELATVEQLEMLTDMVTQIREMTERVGMKKGKPILVLVRVPDSVDYCRGVGVDLEEWMKKGLIDIVVGSGYFRLNPWTYLVDKGHKYGVKVYAGLSEPRVKNEYPLLQRLSNPVYRARSAAAWQAGVDGLYIFNDYNVKSQHLSEIGNAQKLQAKNNLYFVTYRDKSPDSYLKDGLSYKVIPRLSPYKSKMIETNPLLFDMEIGDESLPAKVSLLIYSQGGEPKDIKAAFNNNPLKYIKSTTDGLSVFDIPNESVKAGINSLAISNILGEEEIKLLDAAILFYRDSNDPETKELAELCFDQ